MNPADIRKLLGGYAADTLTAEERQALFEAALTDQDLFNELAREQALKELLEDPGARRQLLSALEEKPAFAERLRAWMGRSMAWVAAGSLAVAALLVVVVVRRAEAPLAPEPVITAKLEAPALPAAPPPLAQTAADREKGAVAPTAIPAATPTSAKEAPPEQRSEITSGQAAGGGGVVQPPRAAEVVSEGNSAVRSDAGEARPGGVVGGIAGAAGGYVRAQGGRGGGPPAAVSEEVIVQAEAPARDQVTVVPTAPAITGIRAETRKALSLSTVEMADAAADKKLNEAMIPRPVPYRILRAGADGRFAEAPTGTAFRTLDRVRVVFSPPGRGRLVVTAANRSRLLLDRAVRQGAMIDLDVPASVSSVQVTFTAQPEQSDAAGIQPAAAPAPVTFSIAIPRETAP